MAIFIPTLKHIQNLRVQPETGEWFLLKFLEQSLDDNYEIYFNPYMNGDRPDVIVMRKGGGVMIIEVKDWTLDLYSLNERKQWILKKNNAILKSPISQALKYKDNLFELHIYKLLELKIKNIKNFNIVVCAIYFHNANSGQIYNTIIEPFRNDVEYQDTLKNNIDLLGRDNLTKAYFDKILDKRWISRRSKYFTEELYNSFKHFLVPPIHMINEGRFIPYSPKQKSIIFESKKQQQRIKGVMGSGKTTVLAARAVYAYKRTIEQNPDAKVLILTFNITLKNFIHDKISAVREEFPWSAFIINNYHEFISSQINNHNIDFNIPKNSTSENRFSYLDREFYSNENLFESYKELTQRYDVVLIDEIQDYKRVWMNIVKKYFLREGGEYLLFGDVKQNIYGQPTSNKDVSTNILGSPTELKYCHRSDFKVRDLAVEFQRNIFRDKYDIDDFNKNRGELEFEKQGYLNYMYLENTNVITSLYNIIHGNIDNKNNNISRNDIIVLGSTINTLRLFDIYYRYASNEKTNVTVQRTTYCPIPDFSRPLYQIN